MRKVIATGFIATALVLAGGTAATASTPTAADGAKPQSLCSGSRIHYDATSDAGTFTQATGANSSVTGATGVTLGISTSTTYTVGGSITASATVSANQVVASESATVGVTLEASRSGTTAVSGSWTVPSDYAVGRLAIGALKYKGTVTKYLENSNCVDIAQGTAATFNAPKNEWDFKTFKVS